MGLSFGRRRNDPDAGGQAVDLVAQAHRNAQDSYQGPPEQEPVVATMLLQIRAGARRRFVEARALQESRLHLAEATADVEAAEAEVAGVVGEMGYGSDESAEGRRSQSRVANGRLRRATDAQRRQETPTEALANQVVDDIGAYVEEALLRPNAYLQAFNERRAYEGRPGIGLLSDRLVAEIVGRAVSSPLAPPDQPPDNDTTRED